MPKKVNKLRECVRCHCTKLETYFSTNTKGELYKTCDHCREQKMTYRENKQMNQEKITEHRENNREQIKTYCISTPEHVVCASCKTYVSTYNTWNREKQCFYCNSCHEQLY